MTTQVEIIKNKSGSRRRLTEIDRVTAVAIILVVVGHIVARQPPADAEWYMNLKMLIYQFHMPLFMFCSGLVFHYTYKLSANLAELRDWIVTKTHRLAPGFIIIGLAIIFGKIIASQFLVVDNPPESISESLYLLLLYPKTSAAGSLWYVYVLLEFYILFPVLYLILRQNLVVILGITVCLHIIHLVTKVPQFIELIGIFEYAMYFCLGAIACQNYDKWLILLKKAGWAFVVLFLLSFTALLLVDEAHSKTLVGLASIPAMTFLFGILLKDYDRGLIFVSGYTFVIYLLNTIFIGLTKGLMLKLLPWDGVNFFLYFVVLNLVGIGGPILTYRLFLARIPWLARVFN